MAAAMARLSATASLSIFTILLNLVLLSQAEDEMLIVYSPDYMKFHDGVSLRTSEIPDVLSAVWGFTTLKDDTWTGMDAGNPLKRPEGIVIVEIEGYEKPSNVVGHVFPLETDVEPGWSYQLIADRTFIRFPEDKPILAEITDDESLYTLKSEYPSLLNSLPVKADELESRVLGKDSILNGVSLSALNLSLTPDMKFAMDAQLLTEMGKIVQSKASLIKNGVPDLFWFRVTGIQELTSVYGEHSSQVQEASSVLLRALDKLKDSFVHAYDGNVLIIQLSVDYQSGNSVRLGRSLLAEPTKAPSGNSTYNIAVPYDEGYSAIFNIAFFTMLVFWLAVYAIALGIWNMDPGRDSIIYRMTSQRMKKDQ